MGKLIIPKSYVSELNVPLIFLAGPIKGAPDWQNDAINILFSQESNLAIASPKKDIGNHLLKYIAAGDNDYFQRQRAWERHYLDIAAKTGAILFWLPGEKEHNCHKVYGAMTRLELGQWMTNYKHNQSVRLCLGTDGKFPEMKTISYDLSLDAPNLSINMSLEETCRDALSLAYQNLPFQ